MRLQVAVLKSFLALCTFVAGWIAVDAASAAFTIRNHTRETVHVALVYSELVVDDTFGTGHGVTWTQGWYDVGPGDSRTFTKRPYGYYASSDSYKWNGDGSKLYYVLPFKPFDRISHPITDAKANAAGYQKRSFEILPRNNADLTLSYGGASIQVRNNTNTDRDFRVHFVRPNQEEAIYFKNSQNIRVGQIGRWLAPPDGDGPAVVATINGPPKVRIGIKGSDPVEGRPLHWGFDAEGERVIGISNFASRQYSENGAAFVQYTIGVNE